MENIGNYIKRWRLEKGYWKDHPEHSIEDWKFEVVNGDTRQSYLEWCYHQEELSKELPF